MKKYDWVLFIIVLLFTQNAYGYLDAGTGGMVIQLLLGGFAILGTFIKIYWHKIKLFIKPRWYKIKEHINIFWLKVKLYFRR
ncbi:MAG: hypothetical protein KKE11_03370 [Gammaproteobacteria bacterium]|nr:hypothetical protein [Gammaproteobacteria bacterium]